MSFGVDDLELGFGLLNKTPMNNNAPITQVIII
jgi:hypothetical protein